MANATAAAHEAQTEFDEISFVRKHALSNLRTAHVQIQGALANMRQDYPHGIPARHRAAYDQMVKVREGITALINEAEKI